MEIMRMLYIIMPVPTHAIHNKGSSMMVYFSSPVFYGFQNCALYNNCFMNRDKITGYSFCPK
jgi:hypothetical protein